jgi:hypothetical protein
MTEPDDYKVVLRTADGLYLTGSQGNLMLSNDVYGAVVFDYRADSIAAMVTRLERLHGLVLTAVPLNPDEIFETCDRCRQMSIPLLLVFDGKQFLCERCRDSG